MKRNVKPIILVLLVFSLFLLYQLYGSSSEKAETIISPAETDVYEPYLDTKYQDIITEALDRVSDGNEDNILQTTGGMILKRYDKYLDEIRNHNAFVKHDDSRVSGVYLYDAFVKMMTQETVDQITANTLAGKDGLEGFTGLFERPYSSDYDGKLDSYIIYLPTDYDKTKKYPLVVMLHGYGSAVHMNDVFMNNCEEKDVILICPNGRHKVPYEYGDYTGSSMDDVLQVLNDAREHYNIDDSRIYLTGLSMGGFGTWYIASKNPELFAAIAPLCGFRESFGQGKEKVELERLTDIPIFTIHGDLDPTISYTITASMVQELKDLGGNVTYQELKGYGHNVWDYAYEEIDLLEWFLQYTK